MHLTPDIFQYGFQSDVTISNQIALQCTASNAAGSVNSTAVLRVGEIELNFTCFHRIGGTSSTRPGLEFDSR
jgi:hypothetical protein